MDSNIEPSAAGADAVPRSPAAGSEARGKRGSSEDPLVYLRQFLSEKKMVRFEDDWLDFDGVKIHRSAKCGFSLHKGGPLIDIGSVWYMFRTTSADRPYTQASTSGLNFAYIGIDRRGDLCDFLLGRGESCLGLVKEVYEGKKRPRERAPRMPTKKTGDAGLDTTLGDTISYEDVTKRVRSVQDLDVVIRRPGRLVPNANMILKIAQEEWQAFSTGAKVAPVFAKAAKGQVPLHVELTEMLRKDPANLPIVLVPCNKLAPVTLLNAQDLLQQGTYTRPGKDQLTFFEANREESVQVNRNIGGKLWTFEVRDSVAGFTKEQWMRTVLVIADGNEWQFKGWPFESVVDLFCTIRGVYFQDTGKPLPKHVHEWPCLKLPLPNVSTQHRFGTLRDEIFLDLEEFMNTTRAKKFVNESQLDGGKRQIVETCLNIL